LAAVAVAVLQELLLVFQPFLLLVVVKEAILQVFLEVLAVVLVRDLQVVETLADIHR
jgi:hypothetical protein